jgi:hypothetical protein
MNGKNDKFRQKFMKGLLKWSLKELEIRGLTG